jgi:hypothetical protein
VEVHSTGRWPVHEGDPNFGRESQHPLRVSPPKS